MQRDLSSLSLSTSELLATPNIPQCLGALFHVSACPYNTLMIFKALDTPGADYAS